MCQGTQKGGYFRPKQLSAWKAAIRAGMPALGLHFPNQYLSYLLSPSVPSSPITQIRPWRRTPSKTRPETETFAEKSGNFIELSVLFSRDIEKPKSRESRVGKRWPPIRREGGRSALRGCQRHVDNGTGFTSCSPLILQAQSTLLLQLLKAREGTSG